MPARHSAGQNARAYTEQQREEPREGAAGDFAVSLGDLHRALTGLDPGGAYRHVTYNLTARNAFDRHAPWWVFMPYGRWSDPPAAPDSSPLQEAILRAIPAAGAQECFVDILHVGTAASGFFKDEKASRQIAPALAGLINAAPASATPIVRYLVGDPYESDPAQDGLLQTLFHSGLVRHPNAWFYHGNFTPGLHIPQPMARMLAFQLKPALAGIWHLLVKEVRNLGADLAADLRKLEGDLAEWFGGRTEPIVVPPVSWNHAKIFAVNGTHLVTGGGNYWPEYVTGETSVLDMAMSVTGDAAVDAHRFADHLWRYLRNVPATDRFSWSRGGRFADPSPTLPPAAAPLYSGSPRNAGDLALLSVGRNGLWPNELTGYPSAIFDAARDFVLNVFAVVAEKHLKAEDDPTARLAAALGDDNPEIRGLLRRLGVNPAGWATRYARNFAIGRARQVVRLDQQKIVLDDPLAVRNQDYQRLVAEVNRLARIDWDGLIWPFDLLMALGHALAAIRRLRDPAAAVQIVTSYLDPEKSGTPDAITAAQFKARLARVMKGMSAAGHIDVPLHEVGPLVEKGVVYKRTDVSPANWRHGNHGKVVIVDDALCYIGSDNAYPSYCQEFGLWFDDAAAVREFVARHWQHLWRFAREGP